MAHSENRKSRADRKSTPEKTPKNDPATPLSPPETDLNEAKSTLSRLSIPLDGDGKPAFDQMRDSTKAKLAALISDPNVGKTLGLVRDPISDAQIPDAFFLPLVQMLSGLETVLIAKVTRAPGDLVARIAPYSREEVNQLVPLIAKVANKHAGAYLSKWGEESMLLAMLAMMTTAKIAAIREEMGRLGPRPVVTFPSSPVNPPAPGADSTDGLTSGDTPGL